MSDATETQSSGPAFEVEIMDEEALAEAARPKSFNDKITVKGRVKRATRLADPAKGGELAGSPQVNLLVEVFADPDDAQSAMDDPVVWHRMALALVTEKGKKLSNKALGIVNGHLHALFPDEIPQARKGGTIDETLVAFRKTQEKSYGLWTDDEELKSLVGKVFTFDIAVSEGREGGVFVNLRRPRAALYDNESYTDTDALVA